MPTHRLFVNTDVVTMDPEKPKANAFLIAGHRFLAVGDRKTLVAQSPPDTTVVDLGGRTVVPGFIETHNHLSYYALTLLMVDCSPVSNRSIADVKDKLSEAARSAGPGQWVVGWGFDDTLMTECRHLTRFDLDECCPDKPFFVSHASGHLSYVNSLTLKMAQIDRNTPQPSGGEIHKDEAGEPTGLLMELGAQGLAAGLLPKPDAGLFRALLPEAATRYNREGVTSVHDGAVGMIGQGPATIQAYRDLEAEGRLNLRVYMTTMHDLYDRLIDLGLGQGFGSDRLKIGAVKMFQDGSIQGLTAALSADYHNRPGHRGPFIMPQESLDALVEKYHQQGLQIACHANGDAAIESIISAMEKAADKYPGPSLRHMIIHCQTATNDHIARMKARGIVPSYFPNHVYYWGDRHESLFLGPERAARIDPLGSSIRAGLRFTLHADTPVTPVSPLHSIHCAVNRITRNGRVLGPEERITPYEALRAFTTDAAYCSFEENEKGAIQAGLLADFVVLSANPLEVKPEEIKNIQVLETVVGGDTVFSAG